MHTVNTCQWAKEWLRALGELRLQITVQHNSRFLSLVRCSGSVWPNPVAHVAWRSAPCDGVPLPVSPGWQIISGSGDGFWSRPRSPWIPLSQLIPLRRRLREKCKRERRALTPCIHFSAATRAEAVAYSHTARAYICLFRWAALLSTVLLKTFLSSRLMKAVKVSDTEWSAWKLLSYFMHRCN